LLELYKQMLNASCLSLTYRKLCGVIFGDRMEHSQKQFRCGNGMLIASLRVWKNAPSAIPSSTPQTILYLASPARPANTNSILHAYTNGFPPLTSQLALFAKLPSKCNYNNFVHTWWSQCPSPVEVKTHDHKQGKKLVYSFGEDKISRVFSSYRNCLPLQYRHKFIVQLFQLLFA
jgi:hypothetical protein